MYRQDILPTKFHGGPRDSSETSCLSRGTTLRAQTAVKRPGRGRERLHGCPRDGSENFLGGIFCFVGGTVTFNRLRNSVPQTVKQEDKLPRRYILVRRRNCLRN